MGADAVVAVATAVAAVAAQSFYKQKCFLRGESSIFNSAFWKTDDGDDS